ncbi:uncharacterized protein LOC106866442 [Brachypodium distachyon]|uniref:uncharacterized protein LOC106866442 n=1 Tax=Brachypodium distachyon TaxID=15368 RepID=UPI000D0DF02D|nr:uncharacterized protein LOC106866442 [Brachypodium distachyon]|eukprot:XP_024316255.1 uncharacterized protein LOC106866442 [Brachypodium distachyon]
MRTRPHLSEMVLAVLCEIPPLHNTCSRLLRWEDPWTCRQDLMQCALHPVLNSSACLKENGMAFSPLLPTQMSARNRKKRKLALDITRGHAAGAPFTSPLAVGWTGFTSEECELLKATHRKKRSYYGGPGYRCSRCVSDFWYQERVANRSAITQRRVVYNLCCKGGKVFMPPFQQPPAYLHDMLRSAHC